MLMALMACAVVCPLALDPQALKTRTPGAPCVEHLYVGTAAFAQGSGFCSPEVAMTSRDLAVGGDSGPGVSGLNSRFSMAKVTAPCPAPL